MKKQTGRKVGGIYRFFAVWESRKYWQVMGDVVVDHFERLELEEARNVERYRRHDDHRDGAADAA